MNKQRRILVLPSLEKWMKKIDQNRPTIEGFQVSRLQYLIHLILSHKKKKHPGSWSVLNMQIMLEQVPRANQYMNFLAKEGIIERKNHKAGRNSTLYRIKNEEKAEFRILTDQNLNRRIEKSLQKLKLRNSKKYPDQNQTVRKVRIDHVAAYAFIEEEYQNNLRMLESRKKDLEKKKFERKIKKIDGRRNFCLAEVEKIRLGEIYIKVNDTNYRYDTNFTHLPGEISEFLSIDNQPLVELDIANSQPFFSACLFEMKPSVEAVLNKYLGRSFTISTKNLQYSNCEDVKLYTSLVCSGRFYEYMAEKFNEAGIPYENRKDLKRQLFIVFFGKGISYKYNDAAKIFKKEFPNVHRLFYTIKEKQHNHLAILLQRIESHVMLNHVVPRIKAEYPDLHILTKHDSVQPFKQRAYYPKPTGVYASFEIIGKIMLDTIEQETGLRPSGKAKRFPKIPETVPSGSDMSQEVTAKPLG